MGRAFKVAGAVLTAVLTLSSIVLFTSAPTEATSYLPGCTSNSPWEDDRDMTTSCSPGDMIGTSFNTIADRRSSDPVNGLLKPARIDLFRAQGFSENFLWYAPEFTFTMPASGGPNWAACRELAPDVAVGEECAPSDVIYKPMAQVVAPGARFSAIGDQESFIILGCGNNSEATPPIYRQLLRGAKFRDDSRDGRRDPGEIGLGGWEIVVSQVSSDVGTPLGEVARTTTGLDGRYEVDLSSFPPGRYEVREVVQDDWKPYTSNPQYFQLSFGSGNTEHVIDFGNAETRADVAKLGMSISSIPDRLEVGQDFRVDVDATIINHGPAEFVDIIDELELIVTGIDNEEVCGVTPLTGPRSRRLRVGQPVVLDFAFTVRCGRPSMHRFTLRDTIRVVSEDIEDDNQVNNVLVDESFMQPVWADTDLAVDHVLDCQERTWVNTEASCVTTVSIVNTGFDDVDARVVSGLTVPNDCLYFLVGAEPVRDVLGLTNGGSATLVYEYSITCTDRSFHEITATSEVTPIDRHVVDVDETNNTAGIDLDILEVFNDATMAPTDVYVWCNETIGDPTVTCEASVTVEKTGPAPNVDAIVTATLVDNPECAGASSQTTATVIDTEPQTFTFKWTLACDLADTLHSFSVIADVAPDTRPEVDPHAVDEPSPASDVFVVPYCLPTVNPHGRKEPQAPGTGMNEDGFYKFGTLPAHLGHDVYVRDDASGTVFGPFGDGTRIKWVEANGARPSISKMGGNNGSGRGQAIAVDYQIRANGDAEALFIDERGNEITVTCLVPPFPK